MPASVTSSTVCPASTSATSAGSRDDLDLVVETDHPAGDGDTERGGQGPGAAGVLGRDDVGGAEGVAESLRGVTDLAHRCGGQYESSLSGALGLAPDLLPAWGSAYDRDVTVTDHRPTPAPDRRLLSPGPLVPPPDLGPTDRPRGWIVTAFVTALAAITRFTMLALPDRREDTRLRREALRAAGLAGAHRRRGSRTTPAYGLVVHPPVGKQLIAVGEALFGYNGWGWRFSSAVAGTMLVLLVVRIVRRMTRSTLVGAIAGLLLIVDGVTFVSSRLGMLDIFQAVFVVAAFGCLIVDRDDIRARMARVQAEGRIGDSAWGPRLGVRWWRFGAGVMLGLAMRHQVVRPVLHRVLRTAVAWRSTSPHAAPTGCRRPWIGTALRDIRPALYALVVVPAARVPVDLLVVVRERDRRRPARGRQPDRPRQRVLVRTRRAAVALVLQRQRAPVPLRPDEFGGQPASVGVEAVDVADGPASDAVLLRRRRERLRLRCRAVRQGGDADRHPGDVVGVAARSRRGRLWQMFVRRDWRYAAVLTGYGAGLLPWFATLDRQMYYFYAVAAGARSW